MEPVKITVEDLKTKIDNGEVAEGDVYEIVAAA